MARNQTDLPQDPETTVVQAIHELRRAYDVGKILRKTKPSDVSDIAAEHGYNQETGRRLKQLAGVYGKRDLDHLCHLCETYQRALTVSMLIKFITIPAPSVRRRFEKQAVAERWSHVQLERQLRYQFGRARGRRGRRPNLPSTKIDALEQMGEFAYMFTRWAERLQEEREEWLSRQVANDLAQAVEALRTLQATVAGALGRCRRELAGNAPRRALNRTTRRKGQAKGARRVGKG